MEMEDGFFINLANKNHCNSQNYSIANNHPVLQMEYGLPEHKQWKNVKKDNHDDDNFWLWIQSWKLVNNIKVVSSFITVKVVYDSIIIGTKDHLF